MCSGGGVLVPLGWMSAAPPPELKKKLYLNISQCFIQLNIAIQQHTLSSFLFPNFFAIVLEQQENFPHSNPSNSLWRI